MARTDAVDLSAEVEQDLAEEDDEAFDRFAFAMAALDLLRPRRTRVALCTGSRRVRVESGRAWGRGEGARWALISIPARASRRAIALAVAEIAHGSGMPWALDVLLSNHTPYRSYKEGLRPSSRNEDVALTAPRPSPDGSAPTGGFAPPVPPIS